VLQPKTTLREKLIKIGAKVITHARYVVFQMAEVALPTIMARDRPDCPVIQQNWCL
jgi:hypothetical protein